MIKNRKLAWLASAALVAGVTVPTTGALAAAKKATKAKAKATTKAKGCTIATDASLDAANGAGATNAKWIMDCAAKSPLKATGDPVVIGVQNAEGDPNGTFPEYRTSAEAATKFINEELGGIGADFKTGTPGRPIKLEVCSMAISPADSQRCANELAAKKPVVVYSTINFFGNLFKTFADAKIPVIVGTPITPLDFTSPGVYAIGAGGGCLGVHTGLMAFITQTLGKKAVGIPWANTPPGVFCYNDLEKKPINVLNGTTPAKGNALAGSIKDLKSIGVPIAPGQADVTPQAQQVLDFKPDGIVFSAQGADCWTLVSSLGKLGWTPDKIPLVLTGACIDDAKAKEAGDLAKGIYFIGSTPITQPDKLQGLLKFEAQTYLDKMAKYGAKDDATKGFATQGFEGIMLLWEMASEASKGKPATLTADSLSAAISSAKDHHSFAANPINCADAAGSAPYISACSTLVTATQWNGSGYDIKKSNFSGLGLIKGTDLDLGK